MKQSIALLLGGLIVSMTAWAFWHYSGTYGLDILSSIFLVGLAVDNIRLRRQLASTSLEETKKLATPNFTQT